MKLIVIINILLITLLLSGCLAEIRADNLTYKLNENARYEHSPYRWVTISSSGDDVKIAKQLYGNILSSSSINEPHKSVLISKIKESEKSKGRSTNITLREIRELPKGGYWTNIPIEAWVFDNNGEEIVYTVWLDEKEYLLKGPWTNASD